MGVSLLQWLQPAQGTLGSLCASKGGPSPSRQTSDRPAGEVGCVKPVHAWALGPLLCCGPAQGAGPCTWGPAAPPPSQEESRQCTGVPGCQRRWRGAGPFLSCSPTPRGLTPELLRLQSSSLRPWGLQPLPAVAVRTGASGSWPLAAPDQALAMQHPEADTVGPACLTSPTASLGPHPVLTSPPSAKMKAAPPSWAPEGPH